MSETIVVGAGIAGLAASHRLLGAGEGSVLVLEAAERCGGNIRTSREEGFTIEWGVNGFLDNVPETLALASEIGLEKEIQRANETAAVRFLFRGGRLRPVPMKPPSFLASDLLSVRGRLRVLGEPFAPRRSNGDETVHDFAARRIGREAAEVLVDAMVSGVYAGDSRRLDLACAFPKMAEMEREHGSLVRAMLAGRRAARRAGARMGGPAGPAGVLTSFRGGMESFVTRLAERLGPARIRLSTPVAGIERRGAGYRVRTNGAGSLEAERVIVAAPARRAAEFLRALDPGLAGELGGIEYAGLAVVALAYRIEDLPAAPSGFGFLVPRGEGLRILGCLWDSSVFPRRAPEGWVLLRAMIGGSRDPEAVGLPEETLARVVLADLATAMGIRAAPRRRWIYRHPLGIPQYVIGHAARLARIGEQGANWPGLTLLGNSYRGISVNHCVAEAARLSPG